MRTLKKIITPHSFKVRQNKKKTRKRKNPTVQKIKFPIKNFFSSFQRIWSHLLKKSLMDNLIFCAVSPIQFLPRHLRSLQVDIKTFNKITKQD